MRARCDHEWARIGQVAREGYPGECVLVRDRPRGTAQDDFEVVDHDPDVEALRVRFWRDPQPSYAEFGLIRPGATGLAGSLDCPDDGLCRSCRRREATVNWVGDGGVMAYVHGAYQRWCNVCAVRAQIAHAEEAAASLPALRAELAAAEAEEVERR